MRVKPMLLLLAGAAGAAALFIGREASAKHEEPAYTVLRKSENIEIRQYPPVIAAQVEVEGKKNKVENNAFRILAGYIFGKNVSRKKVAMTVPVTEVKSSENIAMTVPVTTMVGDQKMTMRFYMPSKYTMDSLPEPLDTRIKFYQLPATCYAVIKFSGSTAEDNIAVNESKLKSYLKDQAIAAKGESVRAFYDPPWTIPFLRRNEVWLPIDTPQEPSADTQKN